MTIFASIIALILATVAIVQASSAGHEIRNLRSEVEWLRRKLSERPVQTHTPPPSQPHSAPPSPQPLRTPSSAVQSSHRIPVPAPVPAPSVREKKDRGEFFVGKILLSVTAAVLVFIGLIYLALDDKDGIPDWIRIGSMFAVSGICLISGLLMGRRKRDNFNLALTGCGVGSLFIAILLTHVWFGYMADWAAFGLLLLWSVAALYLTRRTDSLLLSVITHIGMVLSICFGYSLGLSDEKLLLLLVYQFTSTAVLIVGNLLCYRRTYHVGLLVSLAMTAAAGGFMWVKFTPRMESDAFLFNSSLPLWVVALAFYLQFIAATYLSYLLSVSAARMKNEALAVFVHAANKLLWLLSAGVNFCLTTFNVLVPLVSGGRPYSEVPQFSLIRWKCFLIEVGAALVLWILHLALTDLFRSRLSFPRPLALLSTYAGVTGITVLLLWFSGFTGLCRDVRFELVMLSVPALILLAYSRLTGEKSLKWVSCILLAIDYLCMMFGGYAYLIRHTGKAGLVYALLYFAVPLAAVLFDFVFSDAEYRRRASVTIRLFTLFVSEFSFISICEAIPALGSGYHGTEQWFKLNNTLIPIGICLMLLLCYLFRFDRPTAAAKDGKKTVWTPVRIVLLLNEIVILIVSASVISWGAQVTLELVLQTVLFAVSLALAFVRAGEFIRDPGQHFLSVLAGMKLTVLVMSYLCGTADAIRSRYVFSVVCMLTALAAIAVGFLIRAKALRLWGLLLTLGCVLKLVTYDMSGTSTLTHMISFVLGGVICFAISAVYTAAEKKLLGKGNEKKQIR